MKNKIKAWRLLKITRLPFHSFFLWFAPFFLFLITLFVVTSLLGDYLDQYARILEMLIWPFTVLAVLFFFRKIFTYFIFAIEKKFNIFGAGEELDSIPYLIRKHAEEMYVMRNREEEIKKNEAHIEKKIDEMRTKEDASVGEWLNISSEILDYSKNLGSRYLGAMEENKRLSEQMTATIIQIEELKNTAIRTKK